MAVDDERSESRRDAVVRVELRDLSKRFGRRKVLSGVAAVAHRGGVLGIKGPNGSGKSTAIRLIAGLLTPDAGDALVAVGDRSLDRFERRSVIGWVAPDLGLYPALTGVEHVQFYARLRGVPSGAEPGRECLDRVGLGRRSRDPVSAYSSGMKQRLRYACALLHRPPVLLLDEPLVTLDAEGVAMVGALVEEQRRRGLTVIAGNEARELEWADHVLELAGP